MNARRSSINSKSVCWWAPDSMLSQDLQRDRPARGCGEEGTGDNWRGNWMADEPHSGGPHAASWRRDLYQNVSTAFRLWVSVDTADRVLTESASAPRHSGATSKLLT